MRIYHQCFSVRNKHFSELLIDLKKSDGEHQQNLRIVFSKIFFACGGFNEERGNMTLKANEFGYLNIFGREKMETTILSFPKQNKKHCLQHT